MPASGEVQFRLGDQSLLGFAQVEDMVVVQNLNPVRTPDSNTKELLVPGDTAIADED